jgi:hypothetical protein
MVIAPDGTATVQAGAGIVADSDPADEDLECRNKAAALLAAVPGARRIAAARDHARAAATHPDLPRRASAAVDGRPGPARFEQSEEVAP